MIDATVAGATANSYLAVADADALAADDFGPERGWWLDAGLEQKELALKRATAELDDALRSGWTRYDSAQALIFPRSIDYSGAPAVAFIPARIRRAAYLQAAFLVGNATVLAAADRRRARGLASASEPNMSYTTDAATTAPVLSTRALNALEGFRTSAGSRGLRSIRMTAGTR